MGKQINKKGIFISLGISIMLFMAEIISIIFFIINLRVCISEAIALIKIGWAGMDIIVAIIRNLLIGYSFMIGAICFCVQKYMKKVKEGKETIRL